MDNDSTVNARRLVLAALVLVGCAAMPITQPDPGKVLADLRAVQAELQALVTSQPQSALIRDALTHVQSAISALVAAQAPA